MSTVWPVVRQSRDEYAAATVHSVYDNEAAAEEAARRLSYKARLYCHVPYHGGGREVWYEDPRAAYEWFTVGEPLVVSSAPAEVPLPARIFHADGTPV